MEIGNKIKQLRLQCDLTQEELANRCELTKGYISQLENELTSPSIATLCDILSALGTNLKDFFGDEVEKITECDFVTGRTYAEKKHRTRRSARGRGIRIRFKRDGYNSLGREKIQG